MRSAPVPVTQHRVRAVARWSLLLAMLGSGVAGLSAAEARPVPPPPPSAGLPPTPPPPAPPRVAPPATTPTTTTTATTTTTTAADLAARELLGRRLFHDTNLSQPVGTSCASCHNPLRAFAGNHGGTFGVPLGSTGTAGLRNTPTAMYAGFTPAFSVAMTPRGLQARGGQFLDGRADTLTQQALGPLLATAEMNNPTAAAVVAKVAASSYAAAFKTAWGAEIFTRAADAFTAIGRSLEAYERSTEFRPFTSRYDDLLRGRDSFTAAEKRGMHAFFAADKGDCISCHAADRNNRDPAASLFTNHTYVALGVPRNAAIPANADATFFDLGLAGPKRSAPVGVTGAAGEFKIPTLRNVALKSAFMHNGRFASLSEVVGFYATRDIDPRRWYPVGNIFNDLPLGLRANVTHRPPLDLHPGDRPRLTPGDVSDIVAFLGTLTDVPPVSTFGTAQ